MNTKKKFWLRNVILFIALILIVLIFAGTMQKKAGMDYIDRLVEKYDPTGASVALIENGQITEIRNYGYADVKTGEKVSDNTRFRIASISKTTTAYGIMQLVDEGKLDLDVPVNNYLKQWKIPDGEYIGDEVTLRMLMSHTSGISYSDGGSADDLEVLPSVAEELKEDDVHLADKPGDSFRYSEFTGFGICQLVIEDVTGEKFEEYMLNEVFQKNGMEHTDYAYEDNERGVLAKVYAGEGKEIKAERVNMTGAGGVATTSEDLAKFAIALMNYKNGTDSEMFEAQKNTEYLNASYGLGIIPRPLADGRTVYEHNGTLTGCNAQMAFEPESGNGIVVLSNSDKAFYLTYDLMEAWSDHALGQHVADTQIKKIKDTMNVITIILAGITALFILRLAVCLKRKKLYFVRRKKRIVFSAVFLSLFVIFCYIIMYTDWIFVRIWNKANYFLYTFFPPEICFTLAVLFIFAAMIAVRMNMKRNAGESKNAEGVSGR